MGLESVVRDAVREELAGRGHGGGGNGGGSSMEPRIAKLESDAAHIQTDISDIKTDLREIKKDQVRDFRQLFGALVVVALGLAGLMAKGFGWLK
jgi:50S ribosomal subunit-associated GTPase HflX